MRIVKIFSLVILLFTILVACEHSHQNIQVEVSSQNMLHSKIMKMIEKHNVVFYKDFNLLTMTGIEEIKPCLVRMPIVIVKYDSLDYVKEVLFAYNQNRNTGYYEYKHYSKFEKHENYYIDFFFSDYKIPEYELTWIYQDKSFREKFYFICSKPLLIKSHLDFSDSSCILMVYSKAYIIDDTIFQEEFSFDCCDYDDPPFKERTTYGIFGDTTFSFRNTESSPELQSISYTKMYEQDGMFVMKKYNSSVNKKPKKTFYDKKHWISLTWLYAMKTY